MDDTASLQRRLMIEHDGEPLSKGALQLVAWKPLVSVAIAHAA